MKVEILKTDKGLPLPKCQHRGDAGMDLYSSESYTLKSGERKLFFVGFRLSVPFGYEIQTRPRSGLALEHGITLLNSPGTIDYQYRGDIGIILVNHSDKEFEIKKGDRIAQMILSKIENIEFEEVEKLSETERGEGGFGSTGK